MDRGPVEKAADVGGVARVATEKTMTSEDPQVAGLRNRLVGRLGHRVGVRLRLKVRADEFVEAFGVEAQDVQVYVQRLEGHQLLHEQVAVPLGDRRRLVVGDSVRSRLRRRQADRDVDRNLFEPQFGRGLESRVANDDHALLIDDDRLPETEFFDRRGDRIHRRIE